MSTPAPAPEGPPIQTGTWLVKIRCDAEHLATIATGQTPRDAVIAASALFLEAVEPPKLVFAPLTIGTVPPDSETPTPMFRPRVSSSTPKKHATQEQSSTPQAR